tara:strand:- start:14379 stop:15176 length:798 start_codon:yes stop_codon:yes gene_type:complete
MINSILNKIYRLPLNNKQRFFFNNFISPKTNKQLAKEELKIVESLERDGFFVMNGKDILDIDTLRQETEKCFKDREKIEFTLQNNKIGFNGITYADTQMLLNSAPIREFCELKFFHTVAKAYLGINAKIGNISAWRTERFEFATNAQYFHRDFDNFKWLKIFVYLTDVHEENGPHSYIPKSHHSEDFLSFKRIQDEDIVNLEKPVNIVGKAGTIIFADTFGIHKGVLPSEGFRDILQVTLSPNKVAFTDYKNLEIPKDNIWSLFR